MSLTLASRLHSVNIRDKRAKHPKWTQSRIIKQAQVSSKKSYQSELVHVLEMCKFKTL